MKQIDFMVDSASRPELLKETMESLLKNVKFSGKIRWIFHEAILNERLSNECLEYIRSLNIFDIIYEERTPRGEMVSIAKVLTQTTAPYFLHWEDDHILVRELDLDVCCTIFEKYPQVNQISFNKRDTMTEVSGWKKKEVQYGEYKLVTSPHWRISPAIWRTLWIKPKWQPFEGSNGHWAMNTELQKIWIGHPENKTPDAVIEHLGTFYLGGFDEKKYVIHNGRGHSGRVPGK